MTGGYIDWQWTWRFDCDISLSPVLSKNKVGVRVGGVSAGTRRHAELGNTSSNLHSFQRGPRTARPLPCERTLHEALVATVATLQSSHPDQYLHKIHTCWFLFVWLFAVAFWRTPRFGWIWFGVGSGHRGRYGRLVICPDSALRA